ncbi:hypothetical protein BCR44DRAFT_52582, partial [Catenaria anguillulae PL171]
MSASPGASPALDRADADLHLATGNRDSAIVQTPSPFTTSHDAGSDSASASASATIKDAGQDSVGSASATITALPVTLTTTTIVEEEQVSEHAVAASQAAHIALALVSEQDEESDVFDPSTSREHAAMAHIVATSESRQSPTQAPASLAAPVETPSGAAFVAAAAKTDDASSPSPQLTLTAAQLSAHISLLHHLNQAFTSLTHSTAAPLSPTVVAALEDRYFAWLALITT